MTAFVLGLLLGVLAVFLVLFWQNWRVVSALSGQTGLKRAFDAFVLTLRMFKP